MRRQGHIFEMFVVGVVSSIVLFVIVAKAATGTGVLLGTGNVTIADNVIDYDVTGYVYHTSNSTSAITVNSMVQYIYNHGSLDVDTVRFVGFDANYTTYAAREYEISPISQNTNQRVEISWNKTHPKNGSYSFSRTDILAGGSWGSFGGWNCYWYPSSRSAGFYY